MHAEFHPIWGQMMKAGNQNSRFAHQLERYACPVHVAREEPPGVLPRQVVPGLVRCHAARHGRERVTILATI